MIIGVILQTVATSGKHADIVSLNRLLTIIAVGFFAGSRIVIGFGITLALAPAPVLISELAHPKDRVLFTGMFNTVSISMLKLAC
jgi:MFS family permease